MGDGCDNTSLLWTPPLLIITTGGGDCAQRLELDWSAAWHASLSHFERGGDIRSNNARNRPRVTKTQLGKWLMGDAGDLNQSCAVAKKKNTISSSFLNEGCAANKHESNPFKRRKARLGYSGSTQISSRLDMLFCHIQSGKERQEGCRLKCRALVS